MKRINLFNIIVAFFAVISVSNIVFATSIKLDTPSTSQQLAAQAKVNILLEGLTNNDITLLKASGTAFTLEFESGLEIVPGSMESSYFDLFQTQFEAAETDPNPYTGLVDGYDQPLVVNNETENSRTRVAAARCIPTSNSTDDKLASFKVQLSNPKTAGNYSITLKPTVLNNPSAGYNEDTAIDVLVGSDSTKEATDPDAYPALIKSDMAPIVAHVIFVDAINDTDQDQIDDDWEREYFSNLTKAGIGTDYDEDGYLDSVEAYKGMNPKVMDPPGQDGYDPKTDCRASSPWTKVPGMLNNMILYGKVNFGNDLAPEGSYIAAFGPGGEDDCREVVQIDHEGGYYFTIVGSTNGEEISFKLKSASDCKVYDISEKISFEADTTNEKDLSVLTSSTLQLDLVAGWNWVSFNVLPDDISFAAFFGENESKVSEVKTQTQSAINVGTKWMGNNLDLLANISNGAMFKIKVKEDFTLTVTGTPVDAEKPIVLNKEWTWIAYTPESCMGVRDAVDSVFDVLKEIKSQTASKIKPTESQFIGTLNEMCPGKGYAIKTTESGALSYK